MGSSRFPRKMIAKLGPFKIIEWVLSRVKKSTMLDEVLLATTDLPQDDVLVNIADKCSVNVYRGSELDVLKRFGEAADKTKAETIIRVCADNPFVDSNEIDRLIKFYKSIDCDYACNHQNRSNSGYADGFGAEIFSNDLLIRLNEMEINESYREHVTLYLWDNQKQYKIMVVPAPAGLKYPNLSFDIDTHEDLSSMELLVKNEKSV